jgi:hypothetical protein
MIEIMILFTERPQLKLHNAYAKVEPLVKRGRTKWPFCFSFGLTNLLVHSSNTYHLMFKKLLINKFRIKLVELLIIQFNCYTVFSIYNQDNARHL